MPQTAPQRAVLADGKGSATEIYHRMVCQFQRDCQVPDFSALYSFLTGVNIEGRGIVVQPSMSMGAHAARAGAAVVGKAHGCGRQMRARLLLLCEGCLRPSLVFTASSLPAVNRS